MARPRNLAPTPKLYTDQSGNYCVAWTDSATGKTVRRGCGTKCAKEARARVPDILAGWANPPPPADYTIGDLLTAYIAARMLEPHSPSFLHSFTHIRTFFGGKRPKELGDSLYAQYRKYRTAMTVQNAGAKAAKKNGKPPKRVSDATAVKELNALRGAIGWGKRNPGWREQLKDVGVHVADVSPSVRHEYLTRAEARALLDALNNTPHLALFVRLSIATGARMSAVLELKWSDVTFPGMRKGDGPGSYRKTLLVAPRGDGTEHLDISLAPTASGEPMTIDLGRGRGNKRRGTGIINPSNTGLWFAMNRAYDARESFKFVRVVNKQKTYEKRVCEYVIQWQGRGIQSVDLSDAFERAKVPDGKRTQHVLKHSCCSWLMQDGQGYESIAKLVGTSAKVVEKHYGHLSPRHLATVGRSLSV